MTQSPASIRDVLLEMLAAVGDPPYRSARLLRAVELAHHALNSALAREYKMSASGIWGIVHGLSWKHLEGSGAPTRVRPSPCENCDDPVLVEFRYDLQLYLCDSCFAFQMHEMEIRP